MNRGFMTGMLLGMAGASLTALCTVSAQPKAAFPPLRSLRAMVRVEPNAEWRTATLTLYDVDGTPLRTSQVWDQNGGIVAPKTTQVEWRSIPAADPGTYTLVLTVTTSREGYGCQAQDRVQVVGPDGQ